MDDLDLDRLLQDVHDGAVGLADAAATLRRLPYADLGFARVDHHRALRQGLPEAVYAPGKTAAQCAAIVTELLTNGSGPVVLTRAKEEQVAAAAATCPGGRVTPEERPVARHAIVTWRSASPTGKRATVVTAGTADLPVAHEAAATLEAYGIAVTLLVDCGVAGLHRLFASLDQVVSTDAVIVIAGMEGALASVVGGLTAAPVVAVPTSVGYGAGLDGVTALLAMHAACAPGIVVVGIDNGYGAACAVARMTRAPR